VGAIPGLWKAESSLLFQKSNCYVPYPVDCRNYQQDYDLATDNDGSRKCSCGGPDSFPFHVLSEAPVVRDNKP